MILLEVNQSTRNPTGKKKQITDIPASFFVDFFNRTSYC